MPDHGVDLAVDLYRMLVVAKDDLPAVSAVSAVSAVYGDVVAKYGQARSARAHPGWSVWAPSWRTPVPRSPTAFP